MTSADSTPRVGEPCLGIAEDVVRSLLQFVHAASVRLVSRQSGLATLGETRINAKLYATIIEEKKKQWRGFPFRVDSQPEAHSEDNQEEVAGKPDFRFIFLDSWDQEGEYLAMECKRINGRIGDRLDREYVLEGVCRFVDGKYGNYRGRGLMLGYVVEGSATGAAQLVERQLTKHSKTADVKQGLKEDTKTAVPNAYSSRHGCGLSPGAVDLSHCFVELL